MGEGDLRLKKTLKFWFQVSSLICHCCQGWKGSNHWHVVICPKLNRCWAAGAEVIFTSDSSSGSGCGRSNSTSSSANYGKRKTDMKMIICFFSRSPSLSLSFSLCSSFYYSCRDGGFCFLAHNLKLASRDNYDTILPQLDNCSLAVVLWFCSWWVMVKVVVSSCCVSWMVGVCVDVQLMCLANWWLNILAFGKT